MNAFFHALTFFTRIPVPWLRASEEAWKKSVCWYPAVGLVIGALLWGVYEAGLALYSPLLAGAVTLIVWVYITGGLHLDGWMDLADGLGSSRPKEQALTIMKDSRVGAMGVLAALLLLLLKMAALIELAQAGTAMLLLLVPMAARTHVLLSIYYWPYLNADDGVGKGIRDGLTPLAFLLAYAFLALAGWLIGGWQVLVAVAVSLLFALWLSRSVTRKLGALNGDCYGAVIESSEAVMLLVLVGSWWA